MKLTIRIEKQLFSGESEYQRIDVFDSEEFGKFISLDGEIVFSEKDEFIYDEMVTHVPMAVHPNVKDVLIIGGGDGGVAQANCSSTAAWSGSTWWRRTRCSWTCAASFSRRWQTPWTTSVSLSITMTACGS